MNRTKKSYKRIYVEISNVCNLKCRFCPPLQREPRVMSTQEFERVCAEACKYTDYIYLHLMGEPLLHPKLSELMQIAKSYQLSVQITTNGTLIAEKAEVLLNEPALRQVNFSLSSYEANDKHLGLKTYLMPIIDFAKQTSIAGRPYVSMRLWNMDTEQIKGENTLNGLFFQILNEAFALTDDLQTYMEEHLSRQLMPGVYLNKAEKFKWPDESQKAFGDHLFCYGLKDHIGILADGTVVPCCLDHAGTIALGNVLKQDLEDIIHSDRAQKMKSGFEQRKAVEHLCQTCGYATRF